MIMLVDAQPVSMQARPVESAARQIAAGFMSSEETPGD